jgi:hypothetical protein
MTKLLFAFSISSSLVFAGPYTQEDRIEDMQTMAKAMQDIQNGFFFNNFDMIKIGSLSLADTIMKVEPPLSEKEEKDTMTRFMNNKVKMTRKVQKVIKRRTQTMVERFRDGDHDQALQNFTKITKQCMKCHTQLRNW